MSRSIWLPKSNFDCGCRAPVVEPDGASGQDLAGLPPDCCPARAYSRTRMFLTPTCPDLTPYPVLLLIELRNGCTLRLVDKYAEHASGFDSWAGSWRPFCACFGRRGRYTYRCVVRRAAEEGELLNWAPIVGATHQHQQVNADDCWHARASPHRPGR